MTRTYTGGVDTTPCAGRVQVGDIFASRHSTWQVATLVDFEHPSFPGQVWALAKSADSGRGMTFHPCALGCCASRYFVPGLGEKVGAP